MKKIWHYPETTSKVLVLQDEELKDRKLVDIEPSVLSLFTMETDTVADGCDFKCMLKDTDVPDSDVISGVEFVMASCLIVRVSI